MKAFIAYGASDKSLATKIGATLKESDYDLISPTKISASTSFSDIVESSLSEADLVVVVLSEAFVGSKAGDFLLRAVALKSDFSGSGDVILVLADQLRVPFDLAKYPMVYTHSNVDGGISYLSRLLERRLEDTQTSSANNERTPSSRERPEQIHALKSALERGQLTLVCGAGISAASGLPQWDQLLDRLLSDLAKVVAKSSSSSDPDLNFDVSKLKVNSTLIVGQYIKNTLKDGFLTRVQSALYQNDIIENPLIGAIAKLAMPRRSGRPLDSIVTFNFDDILEHQFGDELPHRAIYSEGQRHEANEIPIYHVHGFLPRTGKIAPGMNIVFSEDAYHDQFIDPFSWSNLIQLSKYGQNTCLFVGISLSDPNLRRLLDVSQRKDTGTSGRHYLIQKRSGSSHEDKILDNLRSTDAGALGLSIIWVDDFDDIPAVLEEIAQ